MHLRAGADQLVYEMRVRTGLRRLVLLAGHRQRKPTGPLIGFWTNDSTDVIQRELHAGTNGDLADLDVGAVVLRDSASRLQSRETMTRFSLGPSVSE